MKVIGIFPGGGAMGTISVSCWKALSLKLRRSIVDLVDLGVGTSVGSIIWGGLASGKIKTPDLLEVFKKEIPRTFRRRRGIYPKYTRKYLTRAMLDIFGPDFRLGDTVKDCIITAVRGETKRNHFFKSYQTKDGHLPLLEAITRSYSAPYFFGKWVNKQARETWLDGGTGSMNCPIVAGIWEAIRKNWLGRERVHVISIGTGYHSEERAFDKLRKMRMFKEVAMFLDPMDGGLARYQSLQDNIGAGNDLLDCVSDFTFQHVDVELDRRLCKIDGWKYIDEYIDLGQSMAEKIDLDNFKE